MTVRFRHFVKIRDDRFMAQKGLLQHAADQASLSFWHSFDLFYTIRLLPSRDEAFGHNPNISKDEQWPEGYYYMPYLAIATVVTVVPRCCSFPPLTLLAQRAASAPSLLCMSVPVQENEHLKV